MATDRKAIRAGLLVLIAATVVVNFMAAGDNTHARIIDPWPPVIYFLLVEMLARVPGRREPINVARWVVTGLVAVTAGWISMQHVAEFAALAGWSTAKQYGLAVLLDGGIVALSLTLIVIARDGQRPKPKKVRSPRVEPASTPARSLESVPNSPKERNNKIKVLHAAETSIPDIAAQFDLSERQVRRIVQEAS